MTHALIIPTYRRTDDLIRTLNSLLNQLFKPTEVIIVVEPNDLNSINVVSKYKHQISNLVILNADKPSLINALNKGINFTTCEIITLTDDDVEFPKNWLQNINLYFKNHQKVGGYGGPDVLHGLGKNGINNYNLAKQVGIFTLSGMIGNHHCGIINSPADVDFLKGVNLSFRKKALAGELIDSFLISSGAEICSEIDLCMKLKINGYQVIYDNSNFLIHYPAERIGDDKRSDLFSKSILYRARNIAYIYSRYRPILEIIIFVLKDFFIGSSTHPGIIRTLIYYRRHGFKVILLPFKRLKPTIDGLKGGFRTIKSSKENK